MSTPKRDDVAPELRMEQDMEATISLLVSALQARPPDVLLHIGAPEHNVYRTEKEYADKWRCPSVTDKWARFCAASEIENETES